MSAAAPSPASAPGTAGAPTGAPRGRSVLRAAGLGVLGLAAAAGFVGVALAGQHPAVLAALAELGRAAALLPWAALLPGWLSPLWLLAAWAAATVLLVGWGGLRIGRGRRADELEAVRQAAAALAAGNVRYRLDCRGPRDQAAIVINRMLDQVEQLFDAMGGVTNAIAHDLRTPLTEVRIRLEGILRAADLPDPVAGPVEEAIADIDRLIGVFNSLLRLAELDSGTRRSTLQRTDPVAVTAGMVDFYAPLAEVKGQALAVAPDSLAEGEAAVMADPPLLAQAVGNLMDNAVKYTPRGGRVTVRVQRTPESVHIHIMDNGAGIRPEERSRVLRPFQRGDSSRTSPGSGLGLSLVQSIARFHGGRLVLRDAGPGVCATITLPAAPALLLAAPTSPPH